MGEVIFLYNLKTGYFYDIKSNKRVRRERNYAKPPGITSRTSATIASRSFYQQQSRGILQGITVEYHKGFVVNGTGSINSFWWSKLSWWNTTRDLPLMVQGS